MKCPYCGKEFGPGGGRGLGRRRVHCGSASCKRAYHAAYMRAHYKPKTRGRKVRTQCHLCRAKVTRLYNVSKATCEACKTMRRNQSAAKYKLFARKRRAGIKPQTCEGCGTKFIPHLKKHYCDRCAKPVDTWRDERLQALDALAMEASA